MSHFMGVGIFRIGLNRTDLGCWRLTLRFNVWKSFVTKATNLPYCFFSQFLEQLLKFLLNFTLLK